MSNRSNTTTLNPTVALPALIWARLLKTCGWLHKKGYLQGVFWAIMVCCVSSCNDTLTKFAGSRLEGLQVAFFRFFFSMLTLLPFMLYKGAHVFKTPRPSFHSLRAILGYAAVVCWCTGVAITPLSAVSLLAQTVPLFVLPMAFLILREKVGWQRVMATLAGFIGILVTLQSPERSTSFLSFTELNIGAIWLIAAALSFAASDILNKIMVGHEEHPLTMLFYFAAGTTLIGIVPAWLVWQTPTLSEVFWLFCLGGGANLILYCLIKAFTATDISALTPYRYVELLVASSFGFVLFGEVPTIMTLMGAAIIVPATLTIAVYEVRVQKSER
ncbi:MAG: DMT family transporter [Pseudomonadota bacterium]